MFTPCSFKLSFNCFVSGEIVSLVSELLPLVFHLAAMKIPYKVTECMEEYNKNYGAIDLAQLLCLLRIEVNDR